MSATWSVRELSGGGRLLSVEGEIDLADEDRLVEAINDVLSGSEDGYLVLDLDRVGFIDSSGVRALLRLHQLHNARVRLGKLSSPVRRVLDIAGLTERFGIDGEVSPC